MTYLEALHLSRGIWADLAESGACKKPQAIRLSYPQGCPLCAYFTNEFHLSKCHLCPFSSQALRVCKEVFPRWYFAWTKKKRREYASQIRDYLTDLIGAEEAAEADVEAM